MDANPHSTKEGILSWKKIALKGRTMTPKQKEWKSKTPVCLYMSLKNYSECSSVYYQPLTDGSDHT